MKNPDDSRPEKFLSAALIVFLALRLAAELALFFHWKTFPTTK